jgi:capsular polysaccharide biosynthesis protein
MVEPPSVDNPMPQPAIHEGPRSPCAVPCCVVSAPDGDLGIVDLLVILFQRRLLVIGLAVLGGAVALALVLAQPKRYAYTTVIEIGKTVAMVSDPAGITKFVSVPVENPDASIAKITAAFAPEVELAYRQSTGAQNLKLDLEVKNPRNSELVVLTSKGPESDQDIYFDFHRRCVERLQSDHHALMAVMRANLEMSLSQAQHKLDELKDQAAAPVPPPPPPPVAEHGARDRTDLRDLAANRRDQGEQQARIAMIQSQIDGIRETSQPVKSMRSSMPVGLPRSMIIVIGGLIGLVIGVIAALLADALARRAKTG